ncbi:MAG: hypothetical protein BGO78_11665 [Chloroflexi bacterium 44-23]|nr:MAG: hypothetical protein BGO78_11665 [Chloroflexi bacterium 44-23]
MLKSIKINIILFLVLGFLITSAFVVPWPQNNGENSPKYVENPTLVKDIKPGNQGSNPYGFMQYEDNAYFSALMNDGRPGLWKTNGNSLETELVSEGLGISNSHVEFNGDIYFLARNEGNLLDLWKTNGTSSGTIQITSNPHLNPRNLYVFKGYIYFEYGSSHYLARTDENHPNVELLTQYAGWEYFLLANSAYYIALSPSSSNYYILQLPGSTGMSLDTYPVDTKDLIAYKDHLYFVRNDGVHGSELWRSDGISEVELFLDINTIGDGNPGFFYLAGDYFYFMASDGVHGIELWRTDGTAAGTVRLTDYRVSMDTINNMVYFGEITNRPNGLPAGLIFMPSFEDLVQNTLWFSDGTPEGTFQLADYWFTKSIEKIIYDGYLYFNNYDSEHGWEMWRSDGTPEGTGLWLDMIPGKTSSAPKEFAPCGERLCYSVDDGIHGRELWSSDANVENANLVADINTLAVGSEPWNYTEYNQQLYFLANDEFGKRQLWRTNGSAENTIPLMNNTEIGTEVDNKNYYAIINNKLVYVSAAENSFSPRFWVMDLSTMQSSVLPDLGLSLEKLNPFGYQLTDHFLYLFTYSPITNDRYIWVTDGSPMGTKLIFQTDVTNRDQFSSVDYASLGDQLILSGTRWDDNFTQLFLINSDQSGIDLIASSNGVPSFIGSYAQKFYYYWSGILYSVDRDNSVEELLDLEMSIDVKLTEILGEKILLVTKGNTSDSTKIIVTDVYGSEPQQVYYYPYGIFPSLEKLKINNKAVFVGSFFDGYYKNHRAIIITDGTPEGSYVLLSKNYMYFGVKADKNNLYLLAIDDESRKLSLLKSDGTLENTITLIEFDQEFCGDTIAEFQERVALYNGVYYLSLTDNNSSENSHGCELWAYDLYSHDLYMPLINQK